MSDSSIGFISKFELGTKLPDFTTEDVKTEPMLFNCDVVAARELGGPITKAFLDAVDVDHGIVDTRVHMLMPGWFPCIPGWHHDDVPRSTKNGQPNYKNPEYRSKHAMALINGEVAPTEFATGSWLLPPQVDQRPLYALWHEQIEDIRRLGDDEFRKTHFHSAPSNQIIYFDDRTLHQGTAAVKNGWRWFGRISWNTKRTPTNEVRRQVQVYLPKPMEGW